MTNYNVNYNPDLQKEPSAPLEPQSYQLNIIQSKQQRLLKPEKGTRRNTPSTPKY